MKERTKQLIEAFLSKRYRGATTYEVEVVERRSVESFCVTIAEVGRVWIRSLHDSEKNRDYIEYEMPDTVLDLHPDAPRTEGGHCACHTNWDCGERGHAKRGPVGVVLSHAEQEMIASQVATDTAKLTTQLNAVRRSGFPSSKAVVTRHSNRGKCTARSRYCTQIAEFSACLYSNRGQSGWEQRECAKLWGGHAARASRDWSITGRNPLCQ